MKKILAAAILVTAILIIASALTSCGHAPKEAKTEGKKAKTDSQKIVIGKPIYVN